MRNSALYAYLMKGFGDRTLGQQPGKGEPMRSRRSGGGPVRDQRQKTWGAAERAAALREANFKEGTT